MQKHPSAQHTSSISLTTTSGSSTRTWKSRLASRHLAPPAANVGNVIGGPANITAMEIYWSKIHSLCEQKGEAWLPAWQKFRPARWCTPGRSDGDIFPVLIPTVVPSTIQYLLWQYLHCKQQHGISETSFGQPTTGNSSHIGLRLTCSHCTAMPYSL